MLDSSAAVDCRSPMIAVAEPSFSPARSMRSGCVVSVADLRWLLLLLGLRELHRQQQQE